MTETSTPSTLRRLDTPAAKSLGDLAATFEELQTVLRCCERLVTELSSPRADDVVVDSLWTVALLSYARGFSKQDRERSILTLDDLDVPGQEKDDVVQWHEILLKLRDAHAHPTRNPREAFSVGVAQGPDEEPTGVGVTSVRPAVVDRDDVRRTGAIAYALCQSLDASIGAKQAEVFAEVENWTPEQLRELIPLELAPEPTAPA